MPPFSYITLLDFLQQIWVTSKPDYKVKLVYAKTYNLSSSTHHAPRMAAIVKQPQPTINASPPIGVIAPSHRMPVRLSM